jgi:hypothetical protein
MTKCRPYFKCDERVMLALLPQMPVRTGVLMLLAGRENYRQKGATFGGLLEALACPARTLANVLDSMCASGEVVEDGNLYRLAATPIAAPGRPLSRPHRKASSPVSTSVPTTVLSIGKTAEENTVVDAEVTAPDLHDLHDSTEGLSPPCLTHGVGGPPGGDDDQPEGGQIPAATLAGCLPKPDRFRWWSVYKQPAYRDAAARVLRSGPQVWARLLKFPGDTATHALQVAQDLDRYGEDIVLDALDTALGQAKTESGRPAYYRRVLSSLTAPPETQPSAGPPEPGVKRPGWHRAPNGRVWNALEVYDEIVVIEGLAEPLSVWLTQGWTPVPSGGSA